MSDPNFQQRLRETFQAEAAEHLRVLAQGAAALQASAGGEEARAAAERIFRGTHTLKGAARMVGELEAESLCHALEDELSRWKATATRPPDGAIAGVRAQIEEIGRVLGLPVGLEVAETRLVEPKPEPRAPGAPTPHVRVPGARLDALLLRAEELVSAKLTGAQNVGELRAIAERGTGWKKELERVRPHLTALRRHVDAGEETTMAKELTQLLHYFDWTLEYLRELQGDLHRLGKTTALDQRRLGAMVDHLLDETKEILMQPFAALLETFPGFVRDISRQQRKEIAVAIEGGETEIDRRVLEEIKDALIHLVRNSVDHGIEPPGERVAAGKPARGQLSVAVRNQAGGIVEISIADDGRGIDAHQVTEHARRLKLLPEDAADLSRDDALALVFRSGFSTRATASDLSGRGLGLAIVRERAEQIGGTVSVESEQGKGTTFRLQLPLTLARFRGLFVTAQKQVFVLPAAFVRRVLRLKETAIRRVKNQEVTEIDGRTVVVLRLASVLGLAEAAAKEAAPEQAFLLLVESARARVALRVDEVPHEEEIVMKGLGRLLRGAHQYVGATIVAGGQIVPVLNVSHVLQGAVRRRAGRTRVARRPDAAPRRRTILVAEDSITSRSLLKSILQGAGFEVRTAVDGAEAWTTLKFEPVDLVISDVQMPRMDGFELTAKIRADKALSTLPVILITSLASREDKARGVDAGANAYIVKSSFDQSDLLASIGRLLA